MLFNYIVSIYHVIRVFFIYCVTNYSNSLAFVFSFRRNVIWEKKFLLCGLIFTVSVETCCKTFDFSVNVLCVDDEMD